MLHNKLIMPLLAVMVVWLPGCMSADQHAAAVARAQEADGRMTVGVVQREIRVGMSGAEVAAVLGSPNVVTSDEQRQETWIYDRIASQTAYSSGSGGASVLILGAGASSGAVSRTQRTLTVIIKFDGMSRVRDFSYRSSSF